MAGKTTKKTTKSKITKRNIKPKKSVNKKEENSFGMMMLIITGVALLIYFASNITVEESESKRGLLFETKSEISEDSFTISGKTYSSKEDAYNTLKEIPQTMRTSEEILFVETWVISLEEYN
ncbi:MAG: hypothetical protein CMD26_05685 [Flavobacteriales bacterium]|nr:hypothetical protein [Flavobacteriales bacterium]|tara:strand:- start:24929 stop:25294 length:366 start_codon:yes stop_codon:yes gene_type:complete